MCLIETVELNKSQEEVKSLRIEMEKIQRENEKLIVSLTEKTQVYIFSNDMILCLVINK